MIERVKEYVQTLSVVDKDGYEKRIMTCVEYLDGIGVTEPIESDWQSCLEYLKAGGKNGKTISESTAKANYIGQAKNFYRWCVSQDSQPRFDDTTKDESANDSLEGETPDNDTMTVPAMTDDTKPLKPSKKIKDKSMRINFLLDEMRYKKLAILSVLEDTSLTALLKEGIDLCIAAHETQAAIAEHAIKQSADARSE